MRTERWISSDFFSLTCLRLLSGDQERKMEKWSFIVMQTFPATNLPHQTSFTKQQSHESEEIPARSRAVSGHDVCVAQMSSVSR